MRLPPEIEGAGYRLIVLDATGSTNDDAGRLARDGDPGRLWIVAREQRAGRGRHGRPWTSPRGNLYASLLLTHACEPGVAPQLGFIAGLALHEAVAAETGVDAPRLALKWPNDLLLDDAKVAGLLLEGSFGPDGAFSVVIGFGVNIAAAPEDTPYPAGVLRAIRPDLTADTLLLRLSRTFAKHLAAWAGARERGDGDPFETIRARWMARAAGLGAAVTVRLPTGERKGSFAGLDPLGRLRLKTDAGVELVDAGDLYFPNLRAGAGSAPSPAG